MHNFSENWWHLKSILAAYSNFNPAPEQYSLEDHERADVLAAFLAVAELATPALDRETVKKILSGAQQWPRIKGETDKLETGEFSGVDVPLSLLEEHGIVAFFSGWCTVHCQNVRDKEKVDGSIIPLLQAVEHLKRICYGHDGYVKPHFVVPADAIDQASQQLFSRWAGNGLLPELTIENDVFRLEPHNGLWDSQCSTRLWLKLREALDAEAAFQRWIFCQRVNGRWATPVDVEQLEFEDRREFEQQLTIHIGKDPALAGPVTKVWKQAYNEHYFAQMVTPTVSRIQITVNSDDTGRTEHEEVTYLTPPTLHTLGDQYRSGPVGEPGDIAFLQEWHRSRHWSETEMFYVSLLSRTIEAGIRIDGQMLAYSDFLGELFELAKTRQILRHLLFTVLPPYGCQNFKVLLLSRPDTCDIAMFYLTTHSFSERGRAASAITKSFDDGYQKLISYEYLRAINSGSAPGDGLLTTIICLAEQVNFRTRNFPETQEYALLSTLLERLSLDKVMILVPLFIEKVRDFGAEDSDGERVASRSYEPYFFLGFWLIERLEATGVDLSGTANEELKAAVLAEYRAAFVGAFEGAFDSHTSDLQANSFIENLPWHRVFGSDEGIKALLALSADNADWKELLKYENRRCSPISSVVRQHLQILMATGRPQFLPEDWERIANRVVEIVRTIGFPSKNRDFACLFDSNTMGDDHDLWQAFCQYANLLPNQIYDEFLERCFTRIPLHRLFVLLESNSLVARVARLKDAVAQRESSEVETMGLASLERTFVSASMNDQLELAKSALDAAFKYLYEGRLSNVKNPTISKARKIWSSYGYKWRLLTLLESMKAEPEKFADAVVRVPSPHGLPGSGYGAGDDRPHQLECERFRRYVMAAAYCESDPQKCEKIMQKLTSETNDPHHGFLLFRARVSLYEPVKSFGALRYALSRFLDVVKDVDVDDMPIPWLSLTLDAYRLLGDNNGLDEFWKAITPEQRIHREVLIPYCKALIARGDAVVANQLVTRFVQLNGKSTEGLGVEELLDDLAKALPDKPLMSELIGMVNEGSQRTIGQLSKHYRQIVSQDFERYVAIAAPQLTPDEFLRDVVIEVAGEILLRKKNLYIHSTDSGGAANRKISQEDLINDWFTSLFDKRMAEARLGLRDQKRGGQAESGKGPGEIDGFITHATNRRIALFEAFRLFSTDVTVITNHLNKIAGYDNEALSPVFMVAYCDVADFDALIDGYVYLVGSKEYAGFTDHSPGGQRQIATRQRSDHLWVGMESRLRGRKEVIIYHLLLNMRC